MRFGGQDEGLGRDCAAGRMLPAHQRFGARNPVGAQVELGLIGDPDVAIVDRRVELAHQRQFPRAVFIIGAGVEHHQFLVGGGVVSREQSTADPVGHGPRQVHVDAKGHLHIDLAVTNDEMAFDQAGQALKVANQFDGGKWWAEPVEDVFCLITDSILARQVQSASDFGDEFIFNRIGKAGPDRGIVADPHSNYGAGGRQRLFAQRRQVRHECTCVAAARFEQIALRGGANYRYAE